MMTGRPVISTGAPLLPVAGADLGEGIEDSAGGAVPSELGRPARASRAQALRQLRLGEDAPHVLGNGSGVLGVGQERRVARYLRDGTSIGSDHRRPARHGLEHWQSEAFDP